MASKKHKHQAAKLAIEGEMTIYRASELKTELLAALDQSSVLEIDLAAVTELDTSGVQLLMLAKNTAHAGGKSLRLVSHSQAVLEVFELMNLVSYFGDPLLMSPRGTHAPNRSPNNPA